MPNMVPRLWGVSWPTSSTCEPAVCAGRSQPAVSQQGVARASRAACGRPRQQPRAWRACVVQPRRLGPGQPAALACCLCHVCRPHASHAPRPHAPHATPAQAMVPTPHLPIPWSPRHTRPCQCPAAAPLMRAGHRMGRSGTSNRHVSHQHQLPPHPGPLPHTGSPRGAPAPACSYSQHMPSMQLPPAAICDMCGAYRCRPGICSASGPAPGRPRVWRSRGRRVRGEPRPARAAGVRGCGCWRGQSLMPSIKVSPSQ
jgi:hypothetical protein